MTESTPCAHCGLSVSVTGTHELVFCCDGCRAAHAIISGCGLGDYYKLRQGPIDPPGDDSAVAGFTSSAFEQAHVKKRADGLAEIVWFVHGVHCTACLWLLEQLPILDPGVRQARLAFSESRLEVIYDPEKTSPAQQAATLIRLGYPVRPFVEDDAQGRADIRRLLLRVAIAGASALGSMHLSINLYAGEITKDLDASGALWFSLTALIVAAPALLWSALPMYRAGWAALRLGRATVDLTATVVIAIGVIASVINMLRGSNETYVDALAMFIALLLAGRLTVASARRRARNYMAGLDGVLPSTATRVVGDQINRVATDQLRTGDVVVVTRGEIIPCDGNVLTALSVDAAVINGESRPQFLAVGAMAYAGTTCLSDTARISVVSTGVATRIGGLIKEANRAGDRPTRLVADVDSWQGWFMGVVGLVAVCVWIGWWWQGAPSFGLNQAIAVILVSCPCALGLATPLVLAIASSRAAAQGIILRDPAALEWLGHPNGIRHMVLDKTGTLTEGRMRVVKWEWVGEFTDAQQTAIKNTVVAIEAQSAHPIALGIIAFIGQADPVAITSCEERPGQGMVAQTTLGTVCIGNARLTGHNAQTAEAGDDAVGIVTVTINGKVVAIISCEDPLRSGVPTFISQLKQGGAQEHILSGDEPSIVRAVANKIGVDAMRAHGGLLPEEKAAQVEKLKNDGVVAVIGDGINDAAALGKADVGIGLRGGIEAALGSCRVVIVRHDAIKAIQELFAGARSARNSVRIILAISLAYNVIGVVLAAAGIWGPLVCAVAMPVSSLTAVVIAAKSRYFIK